MKRLILIATLILSSCVTNNVLQENFTPGMSKFDFEAAGFWRAELDDNPFQTCGYYKYFPDKSIEVFAAKSKKTFYIFSHVTDSRGKCPGAWLYGSNGDGELLTTANSLTAALETVDQYSKRIITPNDDDEVNNIIAKASNKSKSENKVSSDPETSLPVTSGSNDNNVSSQSNAEKERIIAESNAIIAKSNAEKERIIAKYDDEVNNIIAKSSNESKSENKVSSDPETEVSSQDFDEYAFAEHLDDLFSDHSLKLICRGASNEYNNVTVALMIDDKRNCGEYSACQTEAMIAIPKKLFNITSGIPKDECDGEAGGAICIKINDLYISDYVIRGTHVEKNRALILPILESKGSVSIDRVTGKLIFQGNQMYVLENFGGSPTITADCTVEDKNIPKF